MTLFWSISTILVTAGREVFVCVSQHGLSPAIGQHFRFFPFNSLSLKTIPSNKSVFRQVEYQWRGPGFHVWGAGLSGAAVTPLTWPLFVCRIRLTLQGKGSNWDLFPNQYLFQKNKSWPIDSHCIELRFIPKE